MTLSARNVLIDEPGSLLDQSLSVRQLPTLFVDANVKSQPKSSPSSSLMIEDSLRLKSHWETRTKRPTIHVLGERHSGTKWITDHLEECFNSSAEIKRGLSRWKHWFQENNDYHYRLGSKAIVVAQFRHVLQWVKAMQVDPYHAPAHFNLSWREYVHRPWTMKRSGRDLRLNGTEGEICQYNFSPHQVVPCLVDQKIKVHDDREVSVMTRVQGDGMPTKPWSCVLTQRNTACCVTGLSLL